MKMSGPQLSRLALSFALALGGCKGAGPPKAELHPVKGKIMMGGQPLTGVQIVFLPADGGAGYMSNAGPNGEYELAAAEDSRPGAALGKYKVTLQLSSEALQKAFSGQATSGPTGKPKGPQDMKGMMKPPFPDEYLRADTSPKEVEVKAGPNEINIEI